MSSLPVPAVTPILPLSQFIAVVMQMQEEFGAVRTVCIFDKHGDPLGIIESSETGEDLAQILARTVEEVPRRRRGKYRGATYAAIAVTGQPDPTVGYGTSAAEAFDALKAQLRKAKLELVYWVETYGDEVRIPNVIAAGLKPDVRLLE